MNEDERQITEANRQVEAARRVIDEIDLAILELLNRRAEQVQSIGTAKRVLDDPVYQPDREERIFDRVVEANTGPLEDAALRRLFERILDESRRLERMS